MTQKTEVRNGSTTLEQAMQIVMESGFNVVKEEPINDEDFGHIKVFDNKPVTATQASNGRWYHLEGDEDRSNWRPSMTTCLQSQRLGSGYDNWLRDKGHTSNMERDAKGQKGTHVHHWCEQLVYGTEVETTVDIFNKIINDTDLSWRHLWKRPHQFAYDIARNLESFMAFWTDKNPTPIACEYRLYDKDLPFAGRLDFVLKMKKAKNSKKESIVLVDLKTGNKYNNHKLQNTGYKVAWDREMEQRNLSEYKIDYIASLYTKDSYRGEPTYSLDYQEYDVEAMFRAVGSWYDQKKTKKGRVLPTQVILPRNKFNLYNQNKGAK